MAKKQILFKTKGMNQDLSVSAFNPEFSFENKNLRLSTNESNTLLSWVNERGTLEIEVDPIEYWSKDGEDDVYEEPQDEGWTHHNAIEGTPIGTAVLDHKLILFTTDYTGTEPSVSENDYIYVLKYKDDKKTKMEIIQYNHKNYLYKGNLNFSTNNPLETLVSYEAENIQKVYWVDGRNQPRMVNIENVRYSSGYDSQFDFIAELQLNETVKVKKMLGANGTFAPGVIQYAFTYYNNHGQESNIFYTTPLYYISHKDRGGSPEEKVANAFKITVNNVDTNFEYLRIYSIQRTSINATPICKRIQDIAITEGLDWVDENDHLKGKKASFIDTGTTGDSVDPTELLYKGGENIIAKTLEQKDNTLFLGNISISRSYINDSELVDNIKNNSNVQKNLRRIYPTVVSTSPYVYNSQLTAFDSASNDNSVPCGGFKHGDYYRLGVQFQYKTGKWSDPICIKNYIQMDGDTMHPQETTDAYQALCVELPVFTANIRPEDANTLLGLGYRKVRPVMVVPQMQDRNVLCQGVLCPTMCTESHHEEYQSSWFFRTKYANVDQYFYDKPKEVTDENNGVIPGGFENGTNSHIPYTSKETELDIKRDPDSDTDPYSDADWNPIGKIKGVEIEGDFESKNQFKTDSTKCSLHSPDIEFDTSFDNLPFTGVWLRNAGNALIARTLGDIDIQTESPTVSNLGSGFIHKNCINAGMYGILAGAYYEDTALNDASSTEIKVEDHMESAAKWIVYPWQGTGSLNNDFNRPATAGTPTAKLKKKVISNLRFSNNTSWYKNKDVGTGSLSIDPQLFSSDEATILKSGGVIYKGNIDTALNPDHADGKYFVYDNNLVIEDTTVSDTDVRTYYIKNTKNAVTTFNCENIWKTWSNDQNKGEREGIFNYRTKKVEVGGEDQYYYYWDRREKAPGEVYLELVLQRNTVRMRYKSTPHLFVNMGESSPINWSDVPNFTLPVVEIIKNINLNDIYGGTSQDAYKANKWIPCGEPVRLDDYSVEPAHWYKIGKDNVAGAHTDAVARTLDTDDPGTSYSGIAEAEADGWSWVDDTDCVKFEYSYGDTYYQRWDCLKTYAFTPEDINQVVEIGSFMLESHVNIDGRYDRNRGQQNNLNMSPRNFNLMNPVYSQQDNFFTYRIMDDEEYTRKNYPNQVTWTKAKESEADVDLWTNITLASVLEMDGDKGEVNKLDRLNDQLLCFQDQGISQILYNENTQISTTEGVPIEIGNSGKVQGKRYLSTTVGCSNKWSIITTPSGLYFMDSNEKSIYRLGEGLQNISQQGGFNAWCKQHIPAGNVKWTPKEFNNFVGYYDKKNQDVLFVNKGIALAYSEKLGVFTSFYDYGNTPWFCNLDDTGIWVKAPYSYINAEEETINVPCKLWKHQEGSAYCKFFDTQKPYWMTLVGNPEPQIDKIFTNLEFRACVDGDGEPMQEASQFKFTQPFDSLEVWNEYQHGVTSLEQKSGHEAMQHGGNSSSLKRKFRIWRCDIPRDNVQFPVVHDLPENPTEEEIAEHEAEITALNNFISEESKRGIYRKKAHPIDRMRNPWLYLKLVKEVQTEETLKKTEIHDVMMTYFT